MHVISRKTLRQFWQQHPESEMALARWFKIMEQTDFKNVAELRKSFPNADQVGNLTVFNIGGNKARLIAAIHYNRRIIYVRHVLTHREYDEGKWKE